MKQTGFDGDKFNEDIRLVENIRWKSVDKDNMEFEARTTCFQREALNRIISYVKGSS